MQNTTTHNPNLMINTYRWGLVTPEEAIELREADEAKAKAKAARTGKPVTIRINVEVRTEVEVQRITADGGRFSSRHLSFADTVNIESR
jgi:hypothetical protein